MNENIYRVSICHLAKYASANYAPQTTKFIIPIKNMISIYNGEFIYIR